MESTNNNNLALPHGWTLTKIEEVCEILDSMRIPVNAKERNERIRGKEDSQLFPYYGATGEVGKIDGYLFEGEYVLLGEDGAPFLDPFKNKAYMVNGKFWVNNHAHILRAATSNKFICHYLNQFNYSEYVTGTTRLKLNQSALREIPVPLPPLNEQKRIVAKIEELFSELDKGVESLQTAQAQLRTYRQALLKHAFEGKLTAQWREEDADKLEPAECLLQRIKAERQARYEAEVAAWEGEVEAWEAAGKRGKKPRKPRPLKDLPQLAPDELVELPELPAGWVWAKLSGLAENIQIGPFGSLLHQHDYVSNGTPLVNPSHIRDLKIVPDWNLTVNEEKLNDLNNYRLQVNDIIMGRRGEMGRCAVVRTSEDGWLCGTGSLFIRLLPSLNADFYCLLLSSQRVKHFLSSSSIGTTMQNLNQKILYGVPVPICSVLEQREILNQIETQQSIIDQLEKTIAENLQKAEALRQAILKKAFAGQLVPQDPDDEPAAVLLARIRAAKS